MENRLVKPFWTLDLSWMWCHSPLSRSWGKSKKDLIKTNMQMMTFTSNPTTAMGVLISEITIGPITNTAMFFVVNAKSSYSVLLGRDWLHSNFCVPSTLHQVLIFCVDDKVEVMSDDHQPFSKDEASIEAIFYSPCMQPIMDIAAVQEFYEVEVSLFTKPRF